MEMDERFSFFQNEGNPYNYKVDIYSLGIILFELLTAFSTEMERRRVLTDLKEGKYPENFQTKHREEVTSWWRVF